MKIFLEVILSASTILDHDCATGSKAMSLEFITFYYTPSIPMTNKTKEEGVETIGMLRMPKKKVN